MVARMNFIFRPHSIIAFAVCFGSQVIIFSSLSAAQELGETDNKPAKSYLEFADRMEWTDGPDIRINGDRLPTRFVVDLIPKEEGSMRDAVQIRFVLVPPGVVSVSGILFHVERPFYLAATELSIAQAAALAGAKNTAALRFQVDEIKRDLLDLPPRELAPIGSGEFFQDDSPARDELEPELESYFDDTNLPLIGCDYYRSVRILFLGSSRLKVGMRMPSFAEWHHAMRAGNVAKFWWGDDCGASDAKLGPGGSPEEYFSALRPVNVGLANPWGLLNIIGNVSEIVLPTLDDWRAIEQGAPKVGIDLHGVPVGVQVVLALGGGVSQPRQAACMNAWSLQQQIMFRGRSTNQALRSLGSMVGLRPVIDIPVTEQDRILVATPKSDNEHR